MEIIVPSIGLIFWTIYSLVGFITLIDVLVNRSKSPREKLAWILVVLFIPFLGLILYFAIGRKNRLKLNRY